MLARQWHYWMYKLACFALAIHNCSEVTVGKRVTPFPPRRSRRALLTHRAPPSGFGVEAVTG